MKKWFTIALLIAAFLFLMGRAFYLRLGRGKNERKWYVQHLTYQCSVRVDSVKVFSRTNGLVYIHPTGGEFNPSTEDRVNQKLKFNRSLQFALRMANGTRAFHSRDLHKYRTGDSLAINSDVDKIYIYRKGRLTAESQISEALSGRLF